LQQAYRTPPKQPAKQEVARKVRALHAGLRTHVTNKSGLVRAWAAENPDTIKKYVLLFIATVVFSLLAVVATKRLIADYHYQRVASAANPAILAATKNAVLQTANNQPRMWSALDTNAAPIARLQPGQADQPTHPLSDLQLTTPPSDTTPPPDTTQQPPAQSVEPSDATGVKVIPASTSATTGSAKLASGSDTNADHKNAIANTTPNVATAANAAAVLTPAATQTITTTIRNKDSLAKIFSRNGLSPDDAKRILAMPEAKALFSLTPGKKIMLAVGPALPSAQAATSAIPPAAANTAAETEAKTTTPAATIGKTGKKVKGKGKGRSTAVATATAATKASTRKNIAAQQRIKLAKNKKTKATTLAANKSSSAKNKSYKQLAKLTYAYSITDTLVISRAGGTSALRFQAKVNHIEPITRYEYAALTMKKGSLYSTAKKAGIPARFIKQVITAFQDRTNVEKILRPGDTLSILYSEQFINGQKIKTGELAAVEYNHKGQVGRAVAFNVEGQTRYFTPEGYSLKSPFVRFPIKYKAISSPFSLHRYHPVRHTTTAHTGVDLRADRGTPIKAASDGVISAMGTHGGYGRLVELKYNGKYSTLYAHLNGFAQGLYQGSRVRQGQVIGYVGSSGTATGTHLHYEFRINDVPHDPLKVKFPVGDMIDKVYRSKFVAQQKQLFAKLNVFKHRVVASEASTTATKAATTKTSAASASVPTAKS
jgi:murein DD-endopeptidase MepM/ murein hydrolase activator NlpD